MRDFLCICFGVNEDRADNDDILWLIKNERNYEASEMAEKFDLETALIH